MAELQIFPPGCAGHPDRFANRSFEQERREVMESVMGALSSALPQGQRSQPDADEMAACSYLLNHLAGIAGKRAA